MPVSAEGRVEHKKRTLMAITLWPFGLVSLEKNVLSDSINRLNISNGAARIGSRGTLFLVNLVATTHRLSTVFFFYLLEKKILACKKSEKVPVKRKKVPLTKTHNKKVSVNLKISKKCQ